MPLTRQLAAVLRRSLNPVFKLWAGGRQRPVVFNVDETAPQLRAIDEGYDAIRSELLAVLPHHHEIPRFHEIDPTQYQFSGEAGPSWRTLFIHLHRANDALPNRDLFPRTVAILDRIPNLVQVWFSILEAGKSIEKHSGPYAGLLRYHMPFIVPANRPPTMRIRDHDHTWVEGEGLLWDDSYAHEVTNDSDGIRVVLIVDILRPLPAPLHLLNLLARRVSFARSLSEPAIQRMKRIQGPDEMRRSGANSPLS